MYQVRHFGAILEFDTIGEAVKYHKDNNYECTKISFTLADGIRMILCPYGKDPKILMVDYTRMMVFNHINLFTKEQEEKEEEKE